MILACNTTFGLNMVTFLLCFILLYKYVRHAEGEILDLGGSWLLKNRNGSIGINACVPGYVHTALLKEGKINDPNFRYNDELYRWIDYDNWTYSRVFDG